MTNREHNEGSQIQEQELFDILSHTTRRMILRELNKQLYLAYSELQILIPQSPGVIYHHLEKLQEKGLIKQRESKEYELAPLGVQAVSYLEKLDDDDVSSVVTSRSSFHDLFLKIPLSRFILKNPLRWAIEIAALTAVLFFLQLNFPVLIVGPFLLPTTFELPLRIFLEIIIFLLMFSGLLIFDLVISKKRDFLSLFAGLLVLPMLSFIASVLLYVVSIIFITVPSLLFWVLTFILQFCYAYVLIHLLNKISKLSFDRSVIVTLLIGYFFLFCVLILG
ncbi:MAG: helix-turn-helix transcriptional regulator [Candidatus Heimdallarchaeota archaeon]|nr:MAG: helix-turn-helix transcriptional regulator [Candidatus Heimdallarchaeota archaeon]